jgi:hypothetical protein
MILNKKNQHHKQQGTVLIVLFLTMLMIVSGVLISRLNQSKDSVLQNQIKAQQHNAKVLAEAKAALMGFAISYAETHVGQPVGYLVCPDRDGDGSAETCGEKSKSFIGCFPYRTLGMQRLTDYFGNELWYVVSGTYKDNPKQGLTSDTNGLFQIQDQYNNMLVGNSEDNRAIAIVFAPNRAINGQTRGNLDCSKPENYLDTLNGINNAKGTKSNAIAGGIGSENLPTILPSVFVNASISTTFNDQMIWITPEDYAPIYEKMNQWVAKRVQYCLKQYANTNQNKYPWAAKLGLDGSNLNYKDTTDELFGRISLDLSNTKISDSTMNNFWGDDVQDNCDFHDDGTVIRCKCFDDTRTNFADGYWWGWWNEWKELVFIAVNGNDAPIADSSKTIELDNTGAKAVIFIANRKTNKSLNPDILQTRVLNTERIDISNYLEGKNSVPTNRDFVTNSNNIPFNDFVLKIE